MRKPKLTFAILIATAACMLGGPRLAQAEEEGEKPKYPPHSEVLKDAKPVDGLIKMYRKDTKLYAELKSSQLDKDFIVLISIARGISEGSLIGGMTWGFGDDWLWQFRKVDDTIQIVRRNVRFKADDKSPEASAVKLAYTDSVLFSLPIVTMGPGGGYIVDLTPVFMSDLPQISQSLPGFSFSSQKSNWAQTKGFEDNVELEVAATYASSGRMVLDTVPDSRGATINVHYSISMIPSNGYKPRLADDRVGYFLTVTKDFSKKELEDRFVRYVNRWNLEKADKSAKLSPPKKPIVFYLEKTVPFKYRKPIEDGILEWNKAFEKVGYVNAIRVIQQTEGDTWDPEDINYNTFRWITAGAGFAMGPSRVNPTTGQILDADIIFDADFVQYWKREYETFTPEGIAALTGGPLDLRSYHEKYSKLSPEHRHGAMCRCELHHGMSHELALASTMLSSRFADSPATPEQVDALIMQGLKHVTMHEVGHTLGLRHNFKSSTIHSLEEINDPDFDPEAAIVGSVMDYSPANIVPKESHQGSYFSPTLGPYDYWAIEYGYKPISGDEEEELRKIATRCAEPDLVYSTDEDTRGIDSDPLSNRFDLGENSLEYAAARAKLIAELWPGLVDRSTEEGEGYQKARQAFGVLLGNYGRAMHFASRVVGGIYVNRDHKGDPDGRAPFVMVDPDDQRQALTLLEKQVFNDKPFEFPPELYNHLATSRWSHWGTFDPDRLDYAVHEVIAMWQDRILAQVMSSLVLTRVHDAELKIPNDEDALTTVELIERLTGAIFAELDDMEEGEYTNRQPAISSLRRNLQRIYLKRLSDLAMGNNYDAPNDCETVAFLQLEELQEKIDEVLESDVELDTYTKAHLRESTSRINKVLEANLELSRP
jgi:hypothetical protein